eukprot:8794227-Lingulodinium_polyedra.AAC.1
MRCFAGGRNAVVLMISYQTIEHVLSQRVEYCKIAMSHCAIDRITNVARCRVNDRFACWATENVLINANAMIVHT